MFASDQGPRATPASVSSAAASTAAHEIAERTAAIKRAALEAGFDLVGVAPAVAPRGLPKFTEWIARGYAGEMDYLAARQDAYADPALVLAGVRSAVMLAMNYRTSEPAPVAPGQGRIARYAWGEADYHTLIRERLHCLADQVRTLAPGATVRGVVDTAPLCERDLAQQAGLGWIGKNTLLLNQRLGSLFFLAALLTDAELAYDAAHESDHCGTCRACLDACPTGAFVGAYVLDARRCISYATIEQKSLPDETMRAGMGEWVFGCDICQDVCPWNHHAERVAMQASITEQPGVPRTSAAHGMPRTSGPCEPSTDDPFSPLPGSNPVDLIELLNLDDAQFRARFRDTPLWRPRRIGVLRSAAIALGNHPCEAGLAALARALDDAEPQLRCAAAWALGHYGAEAKPILASRAAIESDPAVVAEISAALNANPNACIRRLS
jgi:epoxyqueuosine reductase